MTVPEKHPVYCELKRWIHRIKGDKIGTVTDEQEAGCVQPEKISGYWRNNRH